MQEHFCWLKVFRWQKFHCCCRNPFWDATKLIQLKWVGFGDTHLSEARGAGQHTGGGNILEFLFMPKDLCFNDISGKFCVLNFTTTWTCRQGFICIFLKLFWWFLFEWNSGNSQRDCQWLMCELWTLFFFLVFFFSFFAKGCVDSPLNVVMTDKLGTWTDSDLSSVINFWINTISISFLFSFLMWKRCVTHCRGLSLLPAPQWSTLKRKTERTGIEWREPPRCCTTIWLICTLYQINKSMVVIDIT